MSQQENRQAALIARGLLVANDWMEGINTPEVENTEVELPPFIGLLRYILINIMNEVEPPQNCDLSVNLEESPPKSAEAA